jgi:putative ABC transport system permease protein
VRENAIVEELAQDLDDCYAASLSGGASEAEAYQQTLAELSESELLAQELRRVEQQVAPEPLTNRKTMMISGWWQDLRYGARRLRKQPGFTLIAVVTLSLGIGASTTIFSFFNGVLLRPLPYAEPERLVVLDEFAARSGGESLGVSFSNYLDWRAQNQVFTEIGGYHHITFTLTGVSEATELSGAMASHGFFQLLGVAPLLGRTFMPEEDQRGRGNVVILSHGVWQQYFGSDPQIIGRNVTFFASPWQVVGVMPPAFRFPNGVDFWIPFALSLKGNPRTAHGYGAIARLKPGVTEMQAQSEMSNIARRLAEQYPDSNAGIDVRVSGLRDHLAQDYRRGLWLLLGVTGFVLLIACANLANLLLARAAVRQRELAVRAALGASRYVLARQALCESFLLGALGGAAGMFIAWLGLKLLLAALQAKLPYWVKFNVDGRVLTFTLVVSLLTSLLFGVAPAWRAARVDVHEALKNGERSAAGGNRSGLRHSLVVAQVALAFVLLMGAGLMMRSLLRLHQVRLGFNPDNVLTLRVTVPGKNYQGDSGVFFERLLERVNTLPGVESAGAIVALPLTGIDDKWDQGFATERQSTVSLQQAPRISFGMVTQQYFNTLEIPLLAGRAFAASDNKDTPKVAIIDQRLARTHWPDTNPLGQRFRVGQADDSATWYTIVGVVDAVQHDALNLTSRAVVYVPNLQRSPGWQTLVVRSSLPPEAVLTAVKSVVKEMDAKLAVTHVAALREVVAQSIWQPRLYASLFAVFAIVALLLAAVGTYGVMSYAVAARTNEIGIRMALGAERRHVMKLVVGQGMALAFGGVALGLLGAWLLTRLMKTLLFNVSATDPLTFVGVSLVLIGVALLACYLPARKAAEVDPLVALRHD